MIILRLTVCHPWQYKKEIIIRIVCIQHCGRKWNFIALLPSTMPTTHTMDQNWWQHWSKKKLFSVCLCFGIVDAREIERERDRGKEEIDEPLIAILWCYDDQISFYSQRLRRTLSFLIDHATIFLQLFYQTRLYLNKDHRKATSVQGIKFLSSSSSTNFCLIKNYLEFLTLFLPGSNNRISFRDCLSHTLSLSHLKILFTILGCICKNFFEVPLRKSEKCLIWLRSIVRIFSSEYLNDCVCPNK